MSAMTEQVPEVLFVCVHNAGRSQMAAALLEHYGGGRVQVRSAGSEPADRVNPDVVRALAELDDPAETDLAGVRRIPDHIGERVRRLLAELAPTG
jgi:Low molecular weight phosphotyrosine protein phosphatase